MSWGYIKFVDEFEKNWWKVIDEFRTQYRKHSSEIEHLLVLQNDFHSDLRMCA